MAKNLPLSDFVAKIVTDPSAPPATTLLSGFLGAAASPGQLRLYFDTQLRGYIDIAEDDILHAVSTATDAQPLAPTFVWVRSAADIAHGVSGSQQLKAAFLEGPIAQMGHPDMLLGGGLATRIPAFCSTLIPAQCPPVTSNAACPTRSLPQCLPPTTIATCHTITPPCPPSTIGANCPSFFGPSCPSSFGPCDHAMGGAVGGQLEGGGMSTRIPMFCQTRPPQCIPNTVQPPCMITIVHCAP